MDNTLESISHPVYYLIPYHDNVSGYLFHQGIELDVVQCNGVRPLVFDYVPRPIVPAIFNRSLHLRNMMGVLLQK